jgi:hypothetical protein
LGYLADNNPKAGFPYNEVCNFNLDTCGFKNGGSAVWNWRTVNSSGKVSAKARLQSPTSNMKHEYIVF